MKKKNLLMTLGAAALMAASLNAQEVATANAAQPAGQQEKVAVQPVAGATLTAEELSFAAKLSDQNRKVFSTQLNAEQRKVAMNAACSTCQAGQKDAKTAAISPNEAVQKVLKDLTGEKQVSANTAAPAAAQKPAATTQQTK